MPHDLSGLKLGCSEGDGISNVLTLVHSSLCVAMLLEEGGSIKTPSSISIYSDAAEIHKIHKSSNISCREVFYPC